MSELIFEREARPPIFIDYRKLSRLKPEVCNIVLQSLNRRIGVYDKVCRFIRQYSPPLIKGTSKNCPTFFVQYSWEHVTVYETYIVQFILQASL